MVAMLSLTSVVLKYNMAGIKSSLTDAVAPNAMIGAIIVVVGLLLIVWAIWKSKKGNRRDAGSRRRSGRDACIASGHFAAPRSTAERGGGKGTLEQILYPHGRRTDGLPSP